MQVPGFTAILSVNDRNVKRMFRSPDFGGHSLVLTVDSIEPASSILSSADADASRFAVVDPKCCFCFYYHGEDHCFCHPEPCR